MFPARVEPVGLAVFAKAPVPGQAKTRLIPRLGAEAAAQLRYRLLRHTLATAVAADIGVPTLYGAPDCRHPQLAACRDEFGVTLRDQIGSDLGERMLRAFRELGPSQPVLVIGTDCPALTPEHLRHAAALLRAGVAAVIQPAEDGGYVLIGLRTADASLFEGIAWGGEDVLMQTRSRLQRLGWPWRELDTLWDIDRPADLDRLRTTPALAHLLAPSASPRQGGRESGRDPLPSTPFGVKS